MYVMLATQQFDFCYLLKFIIISSQHQAFSLSINVHAHNNETENVFQEVLRKFR